jgi:hypothetical protein
VEIKSAATFTTDFLKRLEWFQALGLKRLRRGMVLYNGGQPADIRGIRVLNPLQVEDIWQTLTGASE